MAEPTRDEKKAAFIVRYQDETTGLLMRSFAEARPLLSEKSDERIGRAMLTQMRAARDLLGRIFDETFPVPKEFPTQAIPNGTAQTPARKV